MNDIFKRWLSYLKEVHVESVQSDYNDQLHVTLAKGRYQLCTDHVIYSYADKYENFRACFSKINLPDTTDIHVLLLGFGMGSIPYMLEKKFNKNYCYTGVEIDPMIIYLASKYVLPELNSEISMIEADAAVFVDQNQSYYDVICIDIFVDATIPHCFLSENFLLQVKESITDDGLILFNHLGYTSTDIAEAKAYFDNTFVKVFPDAVMMKVHKNYMMVTKSAKFAILKI